MKTRQSPLLPSGTKNDGRLISGAARIGRRDLSTRLGVPATGGREALVDSFNQVVEDPWETAVCGDSLAKDVDNHKRPALDLTEEAKEITDEQVGGEAVSCATSAFVNMRHEIRTSIHGILGMTQLLLKTPLDSKQRRFVETVHSSGELLRRIIDDILDDRSRT